MWWKSANGLEDRDATGAIALIDGFDTWLSRRLADAHAAGKDFAFFDTDLRSDEKGELVGWSFVLLDPGDHPPLGENWTVYRLHPA